AVTPCDASNPPPAEAGVAFDCVCLTSTAEAAVATKSMLLEQPRPHRSIRVRAIPRVVADAGVLDVMNVGAGAAKLFVHAPRLLDRNDRIVGAVKEPDRNVLQRLGDECVRIGGVHRQRRLTHCSRRRVRKKSATNDDESGETIGMREREM